MKETDDFELEGLQCFPFHLPAILKAPSSQASHDPDGDILRYAWANNVAARKHRLLAWAREFVLEEVKRLAGLAWEAEYQSDGYSAEFILFQSESNYRGRTPPVEIHRLAQTEAPLRLSQYAFAIAYQWKRATGAGDGTTNG